jgi:adenylate kinase family enzyme
MMNKTKELYFQCLEEGKSKEFFEKEVSKIWDNVDHRFMDKQIAELRELVHNNNVDQAINIGRFKNKEYLETLGWTFDDEYFKLTPESDFKMFEKRFKKNVVTNYEVAHNSIKNMDKEEYLTKKLSKYDKQVNQVVAYYHKGGGLAHYVKLSTYLAMVHNVDLTRSGWNQTLADAEKLDMNTYIIPYHPFSCLYCYEYQNKPLSAFQVEQIIGTKAQEQVGNVLHPNCKCTLSIYWSPTQISRETMIRQEVDEQYKIRQKVNSLTLSRTNLKTDLKIAKSVGNEGQVDKIKARISKLNKAIRDEVGKLPTESLKKQVKAINR